MTTDNRFTVEGFAMAGNDRARLTLVGPLSTVQRCPIGSPIELFPPGHRNPIWEHGQRVTWIPGMAVLLGGSTVVRVLLVGDDGVPTHVACGASIWRVRDDAEIAGRRRWMLDPSSPDAPIPDLDDAATVAILRTAP